MKISESRWSWPLNNHVDPVLLKYRSQHLTQLERLRMARIGAGGVEFLCFAVLEGECLGDVAGCRIDQGIAEPLEAFLQHVMG